MFSSLSNYLPTSVSAAASSLGAMAKSVGAQALSYGSRAIEQLALNDPSAQKVYLGTALTLGGGAGLAKAARDASMSNKSRYVLGGVSAASLASGVYFLTTGIQELYNRSSGGMPTAPAQAHATATIQPEGQPKPGPINICDVKPGLCDGNLGIKREDMPQIEGEVLTNYLNHYKNKGVAITHTVMPSKSLMFTQNEANKEKVDSMISAFTGGRFNPCKAEITASTDGHVLDGHNRLAACRELDQPIHVVAIDAPIENLLETANGFDGVTHSGIGHLYTAPAAK